MQRTENRKKFRINSKKDAHEYFEFICRISVIIANSIQSVKHRTPKAAKSFELESEFAKIESAKLY